MRITQFTDYSLRVLLYLGLKNDKSSVAEISSAFRVSRNHLVKVVHRLSAGGYIKSSKGRGGGIRLGKSPSEIRVGDFVQAFEPLDLLECFNKATNTCPIQGFCRLEKVLIGGRQAFLDNLNQFTLADFLRNDPSKIERMRRLGLKST